MHLFTVADTRGNAIAIMSGLLRGINARVTQRTIQETLLSHPNFPSLLSLCDALTEWSIDNTALQLNTAEQLRELPLPFIAHLKRQGGLYVLVSSVKGDTIHYTDSERKTVTEPLANFGKAWTGVVLLAEADEQSGEANYATKHIQERIANMRDPFLLAGAILIVLVLMLNIAQDFNTPDWLLLVTKATGLLLSGLLVAKQLGRTNALTDRLCRVNANTSCDDVLNSPGAKLWGWLSWTDVGLLYFTGGLLTLLMTGLQPALHPLLNTLALLALPYTVFSLYYQARVLRQWCPLCLGVQGVIAIEGILALSQSTALPGFIKPYLLFLTAFLLPTLAWMLIKPLLINLPKSHQEHNELMALKRDPNLFRALLMQQPQMPLIPADLRPIILGNPNAEHTITMVTNPYCGPCAKAHNELEQLLSCNLNINAAIIFTGTSEKVRQVILHTIALAKQNDPTEALADWYSQQANGYNAWADRYPANLNDPELAATLELHYKWCDKAGITGTPTLYVDGYQLPSIYRLAKIRWLISELEPLILTQP